MEVLSMKVDNSGSKESALRAAGGGHRSAPPTTQSISNGFRKLVGIFAQDF